MRLFYAGDVHGSERCWRKFLNSAKFFEADVLVLGGDITGKVMVPVFAREDGRFEADILGQREAVAADEVEDLEHRVRLNGFYPLRCSRDELERLEADKAHRDEVFSTLMAEEVRRWIELAEERLRPVGIRCYVMPGNDDEFVIDEALESDYVINPDNRVLEFDGLQLLSCSWTNPTPWDSPREETEEKLSERLGVLGGQLDPALPAIFNLHCPPYDTALDQAPMLTEDLRVVTDGGQPRVISVGSRAVREAIERFQPLVSLHGHIHESKGVATLGRTTCINPGSAYGEGIIDGALLEIRDGDLVSYQLVSG